MNIAWNIKSRGKPTQTLCKGIQVCKDFLIAVWSAVTLLHGTYVAEGQSWNFIFERASPFAFCKRHFH